jgi:hypothetical protein
VHVRRQLIDDKLELAHDVDLVAGEAGALGLRFEFAAGDRLKINPSPTYDTPSHLSSPSSRNSFAKHYLNYGESNPRDVFHLPIIEVT